jgi:hypothetical protein
MTEELTGDGENYIMRSFIIFTLIKCYGIEVEMLWTCSTYGGMRNAYEIVVVKPKSVR